MPKELTDAEFKLEIDKLINNGWSLVLDTLEESEETSSGRALAIKKNYKFGSFVRAFGWISQIALIAEKLNHHPDWSNSFDRVEVSLTTHSKNAITELDLILAKRMDAAFARFAN